jgi:hypothetical protein
MESSDAFIVSWRRKDTTRGIDFEDLMTLNFNYGSTPTASTSVTQQHNKNNNNHTQDTQEQPHHAHQIHISHRD